MLPALGTGVYGFAHGAVAPWVRETLKQYVKERDVRLRLLVMEEQIAALYR